MQPAALARRGALLGLAAAVSFGVSAPLAKLLLADIRPVQLAGLLYLGAAAGLWLQRLLAKETREAALNRADLPRLAGIVLSGGVCGPILMLLGLERVNALTGSLLLNLEAPFTVLLAVLLFRDHVGPRVLVALLCICGGAAILQLPGGSSGSGDPLGALWIALGCACWALDNNLTQQLSLRDPFAIVRIKTLVAGVTNTLLGVLMTGAHLPAPRLLGSALLLGSISYGCSVVLDAYALRAIGAAREAAYFSSAPFIGALASWLLGSELGWLEGLALLTMAFGVALLLRERHGHLHQHEELEHEHLHLHDEHHAHEHAPGTPGEPHTHRHRHEPLVHDHVHAPDAHHRHSHH
jgi:drug/metabolite transporter (DMT)-like permease